MKVTVAHTAESAAAIAGYEPLRPLTRASDLVVRLRRSHGSSRRNRRPQPRPAVLLGGTSAVAVVRPSRHSVGGGPRARPATTHC